MKCTAREGKPRWFGFWNYLSPLQ